MRDHQNVLRPPRVGLVILLLILLFGPISCSLFRKAQSPEVPADSWELEARDEHPSLLSSPTSDYKIEARDEHPPLPAPQTSDYKIGTGDVMNVLVYGEPDLTGVARVSNEGFIELPLIGQVRATGFTAVELKKAIEARLRDGYLVKPDVQIILQEYKQDVVHLIGQVATPGPYRITHSDTLMGTISKAGGFTPIAKRSKVKIIRKENGGSRVFFVDTVRITKEGKMEEDVLLMPGDVIIIPERFF